MDKTKLKWYGNRLKQMNMKEVGWRISQKSIEQYEKAKLKGLSLDGELYKQVDEVLMPANITYSPFFKGLTLEQNINFELNNLSETEDYTVINWHDCIDTNRSWPKKFSYELSYKQHDEYGDARKNWEINRHFLFQNLAFKFAKNDDIRSYHELEYYVKDWIKENPFLIGISYTSVMEVAIRGFSWFVAYDLLYQKLGKENAFLKQLKKSILNMGCYVANHYSRYSSANNHLLVELVFLGIIGKAYGNNEWIQLAMKVLPVEMDRQNYKDGVNKEMSIHYQTFVMEAIGLFCLYFKEDKLHSKTIQHLIKHLNNMGIFVSHLLDMNNHIPELGDNDEGKLLDLLNAPMNHYEYVLHLISGLTDYRFIDNNDYHNNVITLYNNLEFYSIIDKPCYNNQQSKTFKQGGYTILKNQISRNRETQIIMDHGDLGFGAICAHGQADALSFTFTVDGIPILVDPGTYIYHTQLEWRDYFRKTINHNTIEVNGMDQSEMLGAFLWGKRAESTSIEFVSNKEVDYIAGQHLGYSPIIHERAIELNKSTDIIELKDRLYGNIDNIDLINTFILGDSLIVIKQSEQCVQVISSKHNQQDEQVEVFFECDENFNWVVEDGWMSKQYGKKVKTKVLRLKYSSDKEVEIKVSIRVNRKNL